MQNGTLLAAVDLGSNSFRLEIGRLDHGQIQRVEYLKETVRQGNGLDEARNLTADALARGWNCLSRFAERLAGFKPRQVRAVATQTLREARNRDVFLARAHQILGFPIDVISGREEARLIYQGVAHLLPQSDEKRLVVDIGGRSTELILGRQFDAKTMESYRVGSVAWSMKYFPEGQFTQAAFDRAEIAAQAVLDEALSAYAPGSWDVAYGSSGTIGAVGDVLAAAGQDPGWVTREGLDWLHAELLAARSADRVRLPGLKDDRRPVIGGGLSVLRAVFGLLGIERMQPAQGALRHGVLYDLLDRQSANTDVRDMTVQRLAVKFEADTAQAERVGRVSCHLLRQLRTDDAEADLQRHERKLGWAARLHEIGSLISHSDYHKHGAYILDNADAAGFSQPELHRLSLLVLGHRGKLRKLEADFEDTLFVHQLLCLRLAVILPLASQLNALLRADGQGLAHVAPWLQNSSVEVDDSTFPIFAARQEQIAHALKSLAVMGVNEAGAIFASAREHDLYREDVTRTAAELKLKLATYRGSGDLSALGQRLGPASPALLLFVGGTPELVQFTQGLDKQARQRYVIALADVNLQTVQQMGGGKSTPIIATQAVPMVTASLPVVRKYREVLAKLFDEPPVPLSLAGFIAARYTYEVLAAMDGPLTRASVLAAFQRRSEVDVGGYRVSFNAQRRSATFVTQSMLTADGRVVG